MRKNDAGLTILEIGDVVRKGNGKVLYTVTWVPEEHLYGTIQVEVKSHNTGRLSRTNVETAVLVQSVQDAAYEAGASVEELTGAEPSYSGAEFEGFKDSHNLSEPVETDDTNEDEAPVVETSSYMKAVLFALNKLQKHVYAGTVRSNVKAKRRALNARQKASRKANR